MLLGVSSTTRMVVCMATSSPRQPMLIVKEIRQRGQSSIATVAEDCPSLVEPGDFEGVPRFYRRHLVRNDARIVCQVFREFLHDFRLCRFARLVAKDLKTSV